jgi:hypothetical protein
MDRKVVRPKECNHSGPTILEDTSGGRVARCLVCGAVGPARETSKEALWALQDIIRRGRVDGMA